jgi:hypothetical protein
MIYGKKVLIIPQPRKEIETVKTKKDYTDPQHNELFKLVGGARAGINRKAEKSSKDGQRGGKGEAEKVDYTRPESNELFKTIGGR